jgi:hypothetical protein
VEMPRMARGMVQGRCPGSCLELTAPILSSTRNGLLLETRRSLISRFISSALRPRLLRLASSFFSSSLLLGVLLLTVDAALLPPLSVATCRSPSCLRCLLHTLLRTGHCPPTDPLRPQVSCSRALRMGMAAGGAAVLALRCCVLVRQRMHRVPPLSRWLLPRNHQHHLQWHHGSVSSAGNCRLSTELLVRPFRI